MFRIKNGLRIGAFATLLLAIVACAQEPTASAEVKATSAEVLQPYLGKWRPTSAAEERNVVSITIDADGLSVEATGAFVRYGIERAMGDAVVLRVTGAGPGNYFSDLGAIALSFETIVVRDPMSTSEAKRQILWIYWCGRLEQLEAGLERAGCSKNGYRR